MQIKKFVASTLKEASAQMKVELGSEAIILSTRVFEDGNSGAKKKMFEIVAGIDSKISARRESGELPEKQKETTFDKELKKLSEKIYNPLLNEKLANNQNPK